MATLDEIKDYTARLMKLGLPETEARKWATDLILAKPTERPTRPETGLGVADYQTGLKSRYGAILGVWWHFPVAIGPTSQHVG